jgi:ribosomal protein S18 acetylase RimI-like enzyme
LPSTIVAHIRSTIVGHVTSYPTAALKTRSAEPVPEWRATLLQPFRDLLIENSWYLGSLFVEPEFRLRGLGRALIHRAAQMAQAANFDTLSLHVFAERVEAVALYHSLGMTIRGSRDPPSHPLILATSPILLFAGSRPEITLRINRHCFTKSSGLRE